MSSIRLIVGLGNVGVQYVRTRHNAGFWFADALAEKCGARFSEAPRFFASTAKIRLGGSELWLMKPSTFMNRSGSAVVALALYYKILPDEILVVHDELDLVPGTMKMKLGGGNAGHNGLKDISQKLSTPDFWRLRIGIGHPRTFCPGQEVYDWVLGVPSDEHLEGMRKCIDAALALAEKMAGGDMDSVQRSLRKFGSLPKAKALPAGEPPHETGADR